MTFGVVVYHPFWLQRLRFLNKSRKNTVFRDPDDFYFLGMRLRPLFYHDLELKLKLLAFRAPASIKLYLSFSGVFLKVGSITPLT
jgi:hypothetical protein